MVDYKEAFERGIEIARQTEEARKEIIRVFDDFKEQIKKFGEGKVEVNIKEFEVRKFGTWVSTSNIFAPKDTYLAIAAYNPSFQDSPVYELAKWEESKKGYPCKIEWGGRERYCEEKKALEQCLFDLLTDALVAEKILKVINYKPKTTEQK